MPTPRSLLWFAGLALFSVACGPPQPDPATPATGPTAAPSSTAAACAAGKGECDGDAASPCETDLQSSAAHCGACGNACSAGQSCVSGACAAGPSIAAASATVCAVVGGHVLCWGDNARELMGADAKGPRATPVVIPGIDAAVAVRLGRRLGCAINASRKLQCFQGGESRELGLISDVKDAAIQDDTLYLVRKNGQLSGVSLGYGGEDLRPVEVPAVKDIVALAAGGNHACALHGSGEVTCWGDPEYTGSGVDTTDMDYKVRQEMASKPTKVVGLKDAVQISVSDNHSCAIRKTKQIVCWGSNWSGELGDGSSESRQSPVAVQLLDDAVEVSAGYHHTCARRTGGKVVCWGEGRSGQLGSGEPGVKGMAEVRDLSDATAITAGDEVSCATRAGGAIACWGSTSRGRLGNGASSEYVTPTPVRGLAGITALALGDHISCAVDAARHLQCWGLPGFSDENASKRGYEPRPFAGLGEIESVTASGSNLCVVNKAKKIYCDPPSKLAAEPRPIELGAVKAVRSSGSTGTLVTSSGQVVLWGHEWNKPDVLQKLNLSGLSDAVSVAGDSSVVCAVRRSGKVACVAFSYRSFDKKDPIKPTSAIEVPGLTDAVSIVGDGGEMCALRKNGEVTCFSTYRVPAPVDPKRPAPATKEKPQPIEPKVVKGLTDVTQLTLGGGAHFALRKDGTVVTWGSNSQGQLGVGDFEYRWEPTAVPGLNDVTTVATGSGQSCAVKKGGDVLCWGRNAEDQAGQPAPTLERAPVPVLLPKAR